MREGIMDKELTVRDTKRKRNYVLKRSDKL